MSDYNRTTRRCSVDQLHPELLQVIQNFFRENELGDLQTETLQCCETISREKNAGKAVSWWNSHLDTTIYTGMLLTSQWLVWVHNGDKTGARINAARLDKIQAELHTSLWSKDSGLEITGYIGNVNARVRGYIAMGTEPAAQKFCEEVIQAINKANPPKPKKLFGWPIG